jgi:hypothetical protein
VLTVIAALVAAMAASDRGHRLSDEFLVISVPILMVGLLAIAAVRYIDNAVTTAESRLRPAPVASAG